MLVMPQFSAVRADDSLNDICGPMQVHVRAKTLRGLPVNTEATLGRDTDGVADGACQVAYE